MTWLYDALWTSACCGAAAVLMTLLTPLFQKRYSARMRCWVWLAIAALLLVPVRPEWDAAPIRVSVPETFTRTITLRQPQRQAESAAPQTQPGALRSEADEAVQAAESVPQVPSEEIAVPAEEGAGKTSLTSEPAQETVLNPAQTAGSEDAGEQRPVMTQNAAGTPAPALSITLGQAAFVVWAAGALAVCLARTVPYWFWKRRTLRRSRPLLDVPLRSYCAQAKRRTNCRTRVTVRISPDVTTPMVVGALHPILLLPPGLDADNTTALMLVHEYMHVRRRDVAAKTLVFAAACVHWFNPAVYLMLHGISRDAELACDEAVLALCGEQYRSLYGRALVAGVGKRAAFTTQFGGGKKAVKQRLEALFLGVRRRGVLTAAALVSVVVCATALVACQTGQTGKGGVSAMVSKPLDTAVPVAQTELPTYTFPLEMWEVEGDQSFMYENEIYELGYGTYLTLETAEGASLPTPIRRSDVDDYLKAYDGLIPGNALVVWVGNGVLNAAVTEDGQNWAQVAIADAAGAERVQCSRVDEDTMYAAVQAGGKTTFYRTDDSGASWSQAGDVQPYSLRALFFFGPEEGLFCTEEEGDTCPVAFYTSDGGVTWNVPAFPDMTQELAMTRVKGDTAREKDGVVYLQTQSRYEKEIPGEGEQYGSFIYVLTSTDGGASWSVPVKSQQARRVQAAASASVRQPSEVMGDMPLTEWAQYETGTITCTAEPGTQVVSLMMRSAVVTEAGNGTVELRSDESIYNREATLRYEGLARVDVSQGDSVMPGQSVGAAGAGDFTVRLTSEGEPADWFQLYGSKNIKPPALCEVPEELREYVDRAGGDRVAVAYTLANALLQGDENAVDNLVFGQYSQAHLFDGVYGESSYPFESLEGFVCSGAWIDVEGEGESGRVLLTLDVESSGTTGLPEGLSVYVVKSRDASPDSAWPENTACALTPLSYAGNEETLDGDLRRAVHLAQLWRTWCSQEAFRTLESDEAPLYTTLFLALADQEATGAAEWTQEDLTELAEEYLGMTGYVPIHEDGVLVYDAQKNVYTLPEISADTSSLAPVAWDAAQIGDDVKVVCTLFADGLGCVPSYQYTYTFAAGEGSLTLRSCSVDSVSKLYIPEVPVTGEALSDDRARGVCRALLENEAQLRTWMFGVSRRVDETDTVQRVQDGVSITYGRSLDFSTAAECAASLANVYASADPLALTGTATRISDGQPFEISLCTEENGKLYTAQAYCIDPYQSVDTQAVKLDYVSDEKITFTVPVTLQSGESATVHHTALAEDGRWVLESLFGTVESR